MLLPRCSSASVQNVHEEESPETESPVGMGHRQPAQQGRRQKRATAESASHRWGNLTELDRICRECTQGVAYGRRPVFFARKVTGGLAQDRPGVRRLQYGVRKGCGFPGRQDQRAPLLDGPFSGGFRAVKNEISRTAAFQPGVKAVSLGGLRTVRRPVTDLPDLYCIPSI